MTVNADLQQDREIAQQLPRAWPAFFESFGRLTPVQRMTIPEILRGLDLLICSATATGKTESVCAPLIERFIDLARPWMVLYVSPTRALVNDLYARLEAPLQRLNLKLKRRTGEYHPNINQIPHILLTTPESFDSILCRGRRSDSIGHTLSCVVALVLDEIHLLCGTARGEQVRWLIERLRRLRQEAKIKGWAQTENFQTIGLSATIPDPSAVLNAFIPQGRAIVIPGEREIEIVSTPCAKSSVKDALPSYLSGCTKPEKVLVFSNSRRRTDDLALYLTPELSKLGYKVGVHHGSLSKSLRLETEEAAKTESKIVLFATSSLEIGIDIGDIDLIVLDGPPPNIPALLQRIGRGNRRSNRTRVMICSESMAEVIIHSAMIEAARNGWLGPNENGPHYAVVRQQIVSYLFQSRKRSRKRSRVLDFLDSSINPAIGHSILDHMIATGELEEDSEGLRLSDEWLERAAYGKIHSNLEDNPEMTVLDEETGEKIATGIVFRDGKALNIGGQLLQVLKWSERKLQVRRVTDKKIGIGDWNYSARKWITGAGQPQTVRRYLGIEESVWPVVSIGSKIYVFHFGGSRRQAVIELAASLESKETYLIKVTEWFLEIVTQQEKKPSWLLKAGSGALELMIYEKIDVLERRLGRPLANKKLPINVRVDEIKRWLQIEEELAYIKTSKWEKVQDKDLEIALLNLIR